MNGSAVVKAAAGGVGWAHRVATLASTSVTYSLSSVTMSYLRSHKRRNREDRQAQEQQQHLHSPSRSAKTLCGSTLNSLTHARDGKMPVQAHWRYPFSEQTEPHVLLLSATTVSISSLSALTANESDARQKNCL